MTAVEITARQSGPYSILGTPHVIAFKCCNCGQPIEDPRQGNTVTLADGTTLVEHKGSHCPNGKSGLQGGWDDLPGFLIAYLERAGYNVQEPESSAV